MGIRIEFALSCLAMDKWKVWDHNQVCWVLVNNPSGNGESMVNNSLWFPHGNTNKRRHDSHLIPLLSGVKIKSYCTANINLSKMYQKKILQVFLTVSKCLDLYSAVLSSNYLTSLWKRRLLTNRLHAAYWHFRWLLY